MLKDDDRRTFRLNEIKTSMTLALTQSEPGFRLTYFYKLHTTKFVLTSTPPLIDLTQVLGTFLVIYISANFPNIIHLATLFRPQTLRIKKISWFKDGQDSPSFILSEYPYHREQFTPSCISAVSCSMQVVLSASRIARCVVLEQICLFHSLSFQGRSGTSSMKRCSRHPLMTKSLLQILATHVVGMMTFVGNMAPRTSGSTALSTTV